MYSYWNPEWTSSASTSAPAPRYNYDGMLPRLCSPRVHPSNQGYIRISQEQFDQISCYLVHVDWTAGRAEADALWSSRPRTYTILRNMEGLSLMNQFIAMRLTDENLPYDNQSLPNLFGSEKQRQAFLDFQTYALSDVTGLEQAKHVMIEGSSQIYFWHGHHLGQGGFGAVDTVCTKLGRRWLARKRVHRGKDSERNRHVQRCLIDELHHLKSLCHRHLVKYVGSYTDKDYIAYLMKPIADADLRRYLDHAERSRPTKQAELRLFFGCLSGAVNYLHQHGIRHRDLSTRNVLVKDGVVFISDFGAAYDFNSTKRSVTSDRYAPRNAEYMAPEVGKREPKRRASDMWSLGVIFLEVSKVLFGSTRNNFSRHIQTQAMAAGREAYVWCNPVAANEWMETLRNMHTGPSEDNETLTWTKELLRVNPDHRATSKGLMKIILESPSFNTFCCLDCWPGFTSRAFEYDDNESIDGRSEPAVDRHQIKEQVEALLSPPVQDHDSFLSRKKSSIESWVASTENDRKSTYAGPTDEMDTISAALYNTLPPMPNGKNASKGHKPSLSSDEPRERFQAGPSASHKYDTHRHDSVSTKDEAVPISMYCSDSDSDIDEVPDSFVDLGISPLDFAHPDTTLNLDELCDQERDVWGSPVDGEDVSAKPFIKFTFSEDEPAQQHEQTEEDGGVVAIPGTYYASFDDEPPRETAQGLHCKAEPKCLKGDFTQTEGKQPARLDNGDPRRQEPEVKGLPSQADMVRTSDNFIMIDKSDEGQTIAKRSPRKVSFHFKDENQQSFDSPHERSLGKSTWVVLSNSAVDANEALSDSCDQRERQPESQQTSEGLDWRSLPVVLVNHQKVRTQRRHRKVDSGFSTPSVDPEPLLDLKSAHLDGETKVESKPDRYHTFENSRWKNLSFPRLFRRRNKLQYPKLTPERLEALTARTKASDDGDQQKASSQDLYNDFSPQVYMQKAWEGASSQKTTATPWNSKTKSRMFKQFFPRLASFCREGNVTAVRKLLKAGCSPGTKDYARPKALIYAIKGASPNHYKCFQALLQYDVDVNVTETKTGKTALQLAIENPDFVGYTRMVRDLVVHGAQLNILDSSGEYPVTSIFTGSDLRTLATPRCHALACLLNAELSDELNCSSIVGVDVNVANPTTSTTPLHLAVRRQSPLAVGMLLHKAADVNAKTASGFTPLLLAANQWGSQMTQEQAVILQLLLEQPGIDLEATGGSSRRTALLQAVEIGCTLAAEMLLECDASLSATNAENQDALSIAKGKRDDSDDPNDDRTKIVEMLTEAMNLGEEGSDDERNDNDSKDVVNDDGNGDDSMKHD